MLGAAAVDALRLEVRRFEVQGLVQGVGYRPFVHRLATSLGLAGWVRNDGAQVLIEAIGAERQLEALQDALVREAPPLARVDRVVSRVVTHVPARTIGTHEEAAELEVDGFTIIGSIPAATVPGTAMQLAPDLGLCARCESELMDPTNRRHRHPFISCTDCGPRWSTVESLPYDRERTSMAAFALCPSCAREYDEPRDRRFHAEGIACPRCGPQLTASAADGESVGAGEQALEVAAALLRAGGIVALHGIGGFHLAVVAGNRVAVERLRQRKHRPVKPFAVMVRTPADAHRLVVLDDAGVALLQGPERPVVIAPARGDVAVAPNVAPGLGELGVMLPSTAVQHLLLQAVGEPLVMTSGNASGEPLAATPAEAWRDLAEIADLLLLHDRPVVAPSDDSVLRCEPQGVVVMRRARGWSPSRLSIPVPSPVPVLGLGADLKATVALAHGAHAWLSAHLGDQVSLAVQERTAATIARFVSLSQLTPALIACDAHPGYASTAMLGRWLARPESAPWYMDAVPEVLRVQHHHAHVAAVLAEHGVTRPVVALAFDGAGWGLDGTVWGGEVLVADLVSMRRVGALCEAPLLGGDLAAREPWRAAMGWLHEHPGVASAAVTRNLSEPQRHAVRHLAGHAATARTSSMGRLFDAAAAILQLTARNSYEGEAAARLEALAARRPWRPGIPFAFADGEPGTPWRLDPRAALDRLAAGVLGGADPAELAAQWHDDVAATAVGAAARALDDAGADVESTVVLCGGVFQNICLLHRVRAALDARGIRVLTARTLPPNDGAIAVGQVAIAAATFALSGSNR